MRAVDREMPHLPNINQVAIGTSAAYESGA